jgi:two-component system phosphate regulon response regulator OmpR
MVLDLMLPGRRGLDICRDLRGAGNALPILMLTAKGDDIDRILGLEIGADDYLPKPCNPRELAARIRAVLRRRHTVPPGAPQSQAALIRFGRFSLNPATRTLERDGEPVDLTTGEFAVLYALAAHPGETLSRDRLLSLARGRERGAFDRSVDVQISRLRRLIEPDPSKPRYLQTVWGAGYVFVSDQPR